MIQNVVINRRVCRLELVATATYNTARLCSSPYVKVSDIVMYLETHQDKLNLNLSRVDKSMPFYYH